jgi:hypothetical protein
VTTIKMLYGPAQLGVANIAATGLSTQALTDSDNAVASVINLPVDGSVTDVGFLLTAENGTSPAFNCGLVTVDSSGNPTTSAYGGSAVTSAQWTSTGWKWVTLSTPATAVAGDFAAIHIYPGGSPPDGSNNITVAYGGVGDGGYSLNYVVAWTQTAMIGPMAIKYSDGSIYGFALTSITTYVAPNPSTTPDEVGAKFTLPARVTCTGAKVGMSRTGYGGSTTVDVILYDSSSTVIASTSVSDKDFIDVTDYVTVHWDAVNLVAGDEYRLAVKPTTAANAITVTKWSVESTAARGMWPSGDTWQWTERTDAGTWTDTDTAIPYMGLWLSAVEFTSEYAYSA